MDTAATSHLDSILKLLPFAECEHLTKIFDQLQKTNTLHQKLIKQLNHEKKLNDAAAKLVDSGQLKKVKVKKGK